MDARGLVLASTSRASSDGAPARRPPLEVEAAERRRRIASANESESSNADDAAAHRRSGRQESATELTVSFRIVNDYAEESLGRAAPVHDRPKIRIHDATGIQAPSAPSLVRAGSKGGWPDVQADWSAGASSSALASTASGTVTMSRPSRDVPLRRLLAFARLWWTDV